MVRSASSRNVSASRQATRSSTRATAVNKKALFQEEPMLPSRDAPKATTSRKRKFVDLTEDEVEEEIHQTKPGKKTKKESTEKRQKPFRKQAPKSFLEKLQRAQTQRMIVISRTPGGTNDCPTQDIDVVGSTGNIYTVTIDNVPSCTCPDSQKGNECKHKIYALCTVLRAPYEFQYQRAFLSSELKTIFEGAPPIPADVGEADDKDGTRKPTEGECPICYMDFDEENNELVWCKAACGNNMHKTCFEQWAASQRGNTVKCVYCRTPWEMDNKDLSAVKKQGTVGEDGYVNVADHFGMSRERDYSTYHPFWVRRQLGRGWYDH